MINEVRIIVIMSDEITKKTKEILGIIQDEKRITYTELKKIIGISDTALSKYLKVLKNENLVIYQPYGKLRLYSINEEEIQSRSDLLITKNINAYLTNFENEIYSESKDISTTVKDIEKKITALFFYTIEESFSNLKSFHNEIPTSRIFRCILRYYLDLILTGNKRHEIIEKALAKKNYDDYFYEFYDTNGTLDQGEKSTKLTDFIQNRYRKEFKDLYRF